MPGAMRGDEGCPFEARCLQLRCAHWHLGLRSRITSELPEVLHRDGQKFTLKPFSTPASLRAFAQDRLASADSPSKQRLRPRLGVGLR